MNHEFDPMVVFSTGILNQLSRDAAATPRRRLNLNLHSSPSDPCQRFFNAMEPDSYLRPHRQLLIPKRKLLIGIRGCFALFVFDDEGTVNRVERFAGGQREVNVGVEVPAGQWSTVLAIESGSILLEVKAGPFDPDAPREFASWAPEEGAPEVADYLSSLKCMV